MEVIDDDVLNTRPVWQEKYAQLDRMVYWKKCCGKIKNQDCLWAERKGNRNLCRHWQEFHDISVKPSSIKITMDKVQFKNK